MRHPVVTPRMATQKRCSAPTASAQQPMESAASECVLQITITKPNPASIDARAKALGASLIACTLLASPSAQAAPPAIGRLEVSTTHCSFAAPSAQDLSCHRIELARKTDNVLRLRFTGESKQPGRGRSLTFVAINPDQIPPLSCDRGQCTLTTSRWQGAVVGVAEALTTNLGIAEGLPKAWPAQGSCKLVVRQLSCRAKVSTGEVFSAEGHL